MAESLIAQLSAQFGATLTGSVLPLGQATYSPSLTSLLAISLADGAGANQANNLYVAQRTLLTATAERISMNDFSINGGAAGIDPVGVTYVNVRVKIIFIRNNNTTNANRLDVGNDGTGGEWVSLFGAAGDIVKIPGNGIWMMICPDATGWTVTAATNHLLKINNPSGATVVYDIFVVGAKT